MYDGYVSTNHTSCIGSVVCREPFTWFVGSGCCLHGHLGHCLIRRWKILHLVVLRQHLTCHLCLQTTQQMHTYIRPLIRELTWERYRESKLTLDRLQGQAVLPETGTCRECVSVSGTLACARCVLLQGPEKEENMFICTGRLRTMTNLHHTHPTRAQAWLFELKHTIRFVVGL